MEVKYSKESIEQVLSLINTLPISMGTSNFDISKRLATIFNILNNPIKDKPEIKKEEKT